MKIAHDRMDDASCLNCGCSLLLWRLNHHPSICFCSMSGQNHLDLFFSFFFKKSEVWTSIGRTSAFPIFFLGWCAIMQHISIGESKLTNIPQALDEWGRMEGIFPVQVTTGNERWVRYARSIFWSTIPHEGSLQSIEKFFFSHAWTFSICLNKLQP